MMWRSLAAAAGLATVTARPGAAQAQFPDTASLAREVPELLRVSGVPGLSVAVVSAGRVLWSGAFGTVNDSIRGRLDGGTVFEAASLSKPVFTYLVLRLADRGEVDLDRPLFELARSSFVWQDRFAGNAAWATNWLWRTAPVNRYADGNAAASLVTTAGDYARFVAAVLTGRGLSAKTWTEFLTPVRETDPGIHIALGIRVEDGPTGRRFFHSGSNGRRFASYMAGDLGTGVGLVFFTSAYDGTSLVRPVASRVFGEAHPPRNWDWFARYDDPRRLAIKSVQRAAVERGAEAARERLHAAQASAESRLTFDDVLQLGAFLSGRGLDSLAVEVLRAAVKDAPDSARAHLALGEAVESAGDVEAAIASYRRASALDGGSGEARRYLRWAEEREAARARRVTIPEEALARYAGDYRERTVVVRGGRLHYGDGADPTSPLVPMGADLFELERDPAVRVRFIGDGVRPAAELVAIYRDGSVDRWSRR